MTGISSKTRFLTLIMVWAEVCFSIEPKKLVHPAPVPNFEINNFCFGDTTYFKNTTQRATEYIWNILEQDAFNDTLYTILYTSTETDLKYLFTRIGKYRVDLTASNGHEVSVSRLVVVDKVARANFAYLDCGSQFMNFSICYNTCEWDFGDGFTSTEISPVHYFKSEGVYKVSLKVKSEGITSVFSDSIHIYNTNDIDGNFTYQVYKDSVLFSANDSASGPFTEYHWTFGDGSVANKYSLDGGRKISHKYYEKDSDYTVFLLVKSFCYSSFSSQSVFVPDSTLITGIQVFPNPSNSPILHVFTEKKDQLVNLFFIDCLGHIQTNLYVSEVARGYNLHLENMPAGAYILCLNFTTETKYYKILRE